MRLVGRERLDRLRGQGEVIERWMRSWAAEVLAAHWKRPSDVKDQFPNARRLGEDHFIFPVSGCDLVIWLRIAFPQGIALITDLKADNESH
ncbi:type II toxin-antitoxin system HigB family toxin [Burkholderia pseudomallei]|uniref:type II toxin-antitoxin system HigB family toxin n=2 Tax=Burkholderia pseudomallei TaxID=28450 RepID=UPI000976280E